MEEWFIVWAVVVTIVFIAAVGLRSLRRNLSSQRAPPASNAPKPAREQIPAAPPPAATSPLSLAEKISAIYQACSHPGDLLGRPEFEHGVEMLCDPQLPLEQLINYCVGANEELAALAAEALSRRSDSEPAVARAAAFLIYADVWRGFFILRLVQKRATVPMLAIVLVQARAWWARNPLYPKILGDFADHCFAKGDPLRFGPALDAQAGAEPEAIRALLDAMPTQHRARLRAEFDHCLRTRLDLKYLNSVGRVWDAANNATLIVPHARLSAMTDTAVHAIERDPPQSFVITGEPGAGKTTLVRAIAQRLSANGWTVFESSAADVLSGQIYIGQFEQRVKELQENLHAGRKVVWYIPQFHELYYSGRHRFSPQGLLDMLLPAVEAGRLCIIGEATPAALQKLLQERPRLRVGFKELQVDPLSAEDSVKLANGLIADELVPAHVSVDAAVVREALDLARAYLAGRALPGSLIQLLRASAKRLASGEDAQSLAMRREDLLLTLSQLTGLPKSVLDEREGLHPADLSAFFAQRVMGQPEAVSCLVDRVAMLKAGLTDPNRPIGVFLFAGPTGTGKTEVAKMLAQFLFGSQERMLRLDMSELQDSRSVSRIIGDTGEAYDVDSLASRIRKQPFSVILLDEFEKAHPRLWDLFLQVFDDGRLTDAQGNAADFRHSIIILTSNLGATEHQGASLGFTSASSPFGEAQVLRTIATTFRPEFVNRIDRVVVFRPLSRAVMRDILKKELNNVLQRRGFRSREWAVEWEESAIEFLLDKGFTRDMGARPLRRAIEQYVLAPIAMSIVEHRFPEGDQFLFVRSDGTGIQVEYVDPDATPVADVPLQAETAADSSLALGPLVLNARGTDAERRFLAERLARLDQRIVSESWATAKSAQLAELNRPGFWGEPERFATLGKVELMDRIEAGIEAAHSIMRRLDARAGQRQGFPVTLLANLAQQIYLLECALHDLDAQCAAEVFLSIEAVASEGGPGRSDGSWPLALAAMYREWGRKRRMRVQVLREGPLDSQAQVAVFAIGGFGVHGILQREAGLHLLETSDGQDNVQRITARVRVAAQPVEPRPQSQSELDFALRCLSAQAASTTVVRRYRREPSPLVRDAVAGWRTGRLDQVLGGDFDLIA
jgi:ATP-dependent Clp protease ATP-binding subunit ClpC